MRFLFILDRHSREVEAVINELGVSDVEIVPVGKTERSIPVPLLERVAQTQTGIGLCVIDRSYRRSLGNLDFGLQCKTFRAEDRNLRDWLLPPPPACVVATEAPSINFQRAAGAQPRLILADAALRSADEIAAHRWLFASKAAALLARYAGGEDLGRMRDWAHLHGVSFAANGPVEHSFRLSNQHAPTKTQWHLTEGNNTTPQAAARIYFGTGTVNGVEHTLIFYVGPHPPSGTYKPTFVGATWAAPEGR